MTVRGFALPHCVPIPFQPRFRLVLPNKRPCFLLLSVPALEYLPAGRLYLIPGHSVLVHHIIVDRLSLLVAQPHFSVPSIHAYPFQTFPVKRVTMFSIISFCPMNAWLKAALTNASSMLSMALHALVN